MLNKCWLNLIIIFCRKWDDKVKGLGGQRRARTMSLFCAARQALYFFSARPSSGSIGSRTLMPYSQAGSVVQPPRLPTASRCCASAVPTLYAHAYSAAPVGDAPAQQKWRRHYGWRRPGQGSAFWRAVSAPRCAAFAARPPLLTNASKTSAGPRCWEEANAVLTRSTSE